MLRLRRSTGFRLQSAGVVQFKKDYLDIPFHGAAVASGGAASRPPTLLESHSHLILHLRYLYTLRDPFSSSFDFVSLRSVSSGHRLIPIRSTQSTYRRSIGVSDA